MYPTDFCEYGCVNRCNQSVLNPESGNFSTAKHEIRTATIQNNVQPKDHNSHVTMSTASVTEWLGKHAHITGAMHHVKALFCPVMAVTRAHDQQVFVKVY